MKQLIQAISLAVLTLGAAAAGAKGVTPYLPLNLEPGIERQIERVLILGGKSVSRRPIPAATVLDALPVACKQDATACEQVRRYLAGYIDPSGITSLRVEAALATGDATAVQPNRHGGTVDSAWRVSGSAHWQPNDYFLVNLGAVGHDDNVTATGSYVSFGFDFAQVDIGFRDHWFSPLTDSSPLIGTQAPTLLSATLSNYEPITRLGFNYEVFFGELSRQEGIAYEGSTTSGRPRLSGLQVGIEPVPGYTLSASRLVQYGGGARNGNLISQFFEETFQTGNRHDTSGSEEANRLAALTGSLVFPGAVPFVARIEYAGEDNAYDGSYRLGATSTTFGLDFPLLWRRYDFTAEVSEWQNSWYVHPIYPRGLTNRGHVLGHWSGDNRRFGEDVGGHSFMLRAGRRLDSGDYVTAVYRQLSYDTDWVRYDRPRVAYRQMQMVGLNLATVLRGHAVDAELSLGQDVFGESFARIGAAFDFAPATRRRGDFADPVPQDDPATEVFIDVGAQRSRLREIMLDLGPDVIDGPAEDYHFAVGARRRVGARHDVGMRLELDAVAGASLVSVRAVDYRFRFTRHFAAGAFFGAGRLDAELPAYGYYFGAGLHYLDFLPGWDAGADFRYHEKMTRDKVLATDPTLNVQLPRRAFDISGVSLYLSRKW